MYKTEVLSKIKPYCDAADHFKELPFYNRPIKKPKVKRLKNIDRLTELPFYERLSVEIIEKKDPIVQLDPTKSSIKDLFSDLLNEAKDFTYKIGIKVLLKKYKLNGEICSSLF